MTRRGPAAQPPGDDPTVKFAPGLGPALPLLIGTLVLAAALAFVLTPLVRALAHRFGMVDHPDERRVNTSPVPRGGGIAVAVACLVASIVFLIVNAETGSVDPATGVDRHDRARGPARWRRPGGDHRHPRRHLPAPGALPARRPGLRGGRGHPPRRHSGLDHEPVRRRAHRHGRAHRCRLRAPVDPGHGQQHEFHRRPRRALVGNRAHRRADTRAHQPHDGGRTVRAGPAVRGGPLLRPRRLAGRVPALELLPRLGLLGDERGHVRRLHAGHPVDPGHGQGRGGDARPGRARSSTRSGSSSAGSPPGARRSPRIAATSTTGCSTLASATSRP